MRDTELTAASAKPAITSFRAGLIGAGIQASRSPQLHEQEARAQGLTYSYELFDLEQMGASVAALPRLLDEAQQQGFAGLNITHPCKQAVISLLDELSAEAAAIGAVNTVVFKHGRRIGHNTDAPGFAASFQRDLADVAKRNVILLGAGGAGSAVAVAVLQLGSERLAIYDTDRARAAALAERVGATAVSELAQTVQAADGLIQATPIGMANYPGVPLPLALLQPNHWVAEIIYFPRETELLRHARALGCRTLDGGGMAVFQAARAFQLFTDLAPDAERMLRHFAALD
ncbi:MAG: shikimate dehydrogenase [Acidobacteria bacterium]|nr:shikimate dehydrogenase [Acidobacteriota bacterium]